MATRIQLRRDTSSNWTSVNPILGEGEIGIEIDTNKFKIGNGILNWNTLNYYSESSTIISKFVFNEVPTGTIDGVNSIFNTSFLLVPDTEIVFINGQKQKKPDDYNISGQTITFTFSPGIGESLTINYIKQ